MQHGTHDPDALLAQAHGAPLRALALADPAYQGERSAWIRAFAAPAMPLSEQEQRVLRSFSEGRSPSDIVHELNISPQTLRNHLHHINQKLGTHNRLEAVTHAMRRKLI